MVVNSTHTILHNAILNGVKNLSHRLVVRFFTSFRIVVSMVFRMGVCLVCLLWSAQSPAQQLLNGSFENNTVYEHFAPTLGTRCIIDVACETSDHIPHVTAWWFNGEESGIYDYGVGTVPPPPMIFTTFLLRILINVVS